MTLAELNPKAGSPFRIEGQTIDGIRTWSPASLVGRTADGRPIVRTAGIRIVVSDSEPVRQ